MFSGSPNIESWASGLKLADFRLIARDYDKTSYSWASATPSALMAAADHPVVQKTEIKHVIMEISRVFLRKTKNSVVASTIFGPFEEEPDVIFQVRVNNLLYLAHYNTRFILYVVRAAPTLV